MSQLGFRLTPRLALGMATLFLSTAGLVGCTAGVNATGNPGRAGSTGTGTGGTITGLGGSVSIVSERGRGTTFRFSIPADDSVPSGLPSAA